jgi:aspartyl-tRNA(Asn)/glutamyl-tRNA(Gln) amidotransferase subunit A
MTTDLALLPATELLAGYRAGHFSPVEVTRACLDRIALLDGTLNAFCLVDGPAALAAASAAEGRWRRGEPLGLVDGVPASVKDLVLTRGWPTLRGSLALSRDQAWDEDAPAVGRLREHGAILLGKTATPEFGHKGVTDSPLTGITRNPWNPELTPGGSSGGAAVAAATGMAALNLGTDGGGSIRIPASFTGVFGLKPSFGRVPAHPQSPFGTIAHVGPITRTVADAALFLRVISHPDARDWHALPHGDVDFLDGLDAGVEGLKIAYAPTLNGLPVSPEVASAVGRAARVFADCGAEVEEIIFNLPGASEMFETLWTVGAATVVAGFTEEQQRLMDPALSATAARGNLVPVLDYTAQLQARARLGSEMKRFHERYDLLILPTLPGVAFAAGEDHPGAKKGGAWVDWTPFTYPFNLSQQPACSIPCGRTAAGLPIGLQIVGDMHDDACVLRTARAFEVTCPIEPPPMATTPVAAEVR